MCLTLGTFSAPKFNKGGGFKIWSIRMRTKKVRKRALVEDPNKVIMTLAKRENFSLLDYWYGNWGTSRHQWK